MDLVVHCRPNSLSVNSRQPQSDQWSDEEIDAGRKKDARATAAHFNRKNAGKAEGSSSAKAKKVNNNGLKSKIKKWFGVKTLD
jgi:hypothetical protein